MAQACGLGAAVVPCPRAGSLIITGQKAHRKPRGKKWSLTKQRTSWNKQRASWKHEYLKKESAEEEAGGQRPVSCHFGPEEAGRQLFENGGTEYEPKLKEMGVQTDPLQTLEPHEERGPAEDVGVEVGFRSASPQGGMEWLRGLWPEGPRGPEDPAAAGLREAEARVAWLMRRLWEEGREIANLREHIRSLENERLEWREAVVAAARGHITRLRSALRREEERTAALAAQLRERGWEPEEEVVFPAAAARGPETEGSEAERSLRVDPTDAEVGVAGLPGPPDPWMSWFQGGDTVAELGLWWSSRSASATGGEVENDTLHWGEEEDSVDLRPWWFDWGRTGPEEETAPPSSVGMEAGEEELEFRQFSLEYPSSRWNVTDQHWYDRWAIQEARDLEPDQPPLTASAPDVELGDRPFLIWIRSLGQPLFALGARPSETVATIKNRIYWRLGTPPGLQVIVQEYLPLESHKTLQSCGIRGAEILRLVTQTCPCRGAGLERQA